VRRARARAAEADLVVWVEDVREAGSASAYLSVASTPTWRVQNKIDLINKNNMKQLQHSSLNNIFELSCVTGEGIGPLLDALSRHAGAFFGSEPALISRERHRKLLKITLSALDRTVAEGEKGREDIIAEELRLATAHLGKLTGRIDVEDILDVIFRDFCIGK
jgi:tRNA modification GTPase